MDKKEFLLRQIAKTDKKNYENYVVTRVIHRVDDLSVKAVTQQYVATPDYERAFTDLYFPQIGVHIEVVEGYHKHNVEADADRAADIIDATGHTILRVDVTLPAEEIHRQVDAIVEFVQRQVDEQRIIGSFDPWDPELENDPCTHIRRGYIDTSEDIAFGTMADACNCFGHSYSGLQRATARHAYCPDLTLWFPKLYKNDEWDNSISKNECMIYERNKADNESFIEQSLGQHHKHRRIVFARVRGPLGDIMYRFKGLYEVDVEASRRTGTITYNRTATRVQTYPPIEKVA